MFSNELIKAYAKEHMEELFKIHRELCLIPAPSHHEEKRAEYCKRWFDENLGDGAYIDNALNVIYPYSSEGSNRLSVVCAHTDTVFPDTEPMPFSDDGETIRCPGVGDDTASLAVMMIVARFFVEHKVEAPGGILFVANSCEEGLGNLKGTRQLFKDYDGRIKQFVSFDAKTPGMASRCVGSHRYLVEVKTEGGHSWGAFGKKNAIAELAGIAREIYNTVLPVKEGERVTYNVGTIEGGTSVNTIAQYAKMLCEYRSTDRELLGSMEKRFADIFESARCDDVEVIVTKVGDRPCMGDVDMKEQQKLMDVYSNTVSKMLGLVATTHAGSTDCNIPLSLGIPAIAVGVYEGGGTHTREEWVKKASMEPGLGLGIKTVLGLVGM
ncbi:MAG: M20/M25/M40 family metallo-hydrolase [Clostridia bacterium]|nr:M20/M25/M40 family metallo-hydrolase [Clostridia bacterium]